MDRFAGIDEPEHEAEVVWQAMNGDIPAFERLVQHFYGTVFAIALGQVRNREVAEELAQETFLRAYLHLPTLRDPYTFAGWLLRIARNLAADWQRTQRRKSALVQMLPLDDEALEQPDTRTPDARDRLAAGDDEQAIRDALFALPCDQREIVLLHYAEERSKSDIARLLNVHPSSVGRRIGAALYALRVQLDSSVRGAVQPLRSHKVAARRAAAIVVLAAALPQAASAALLSQAIATQPGALGLLHALFRWFLSMADHVRTIIHGAGKMITPARIATLSLAGACIAGLLYIKPSLAVAQTSIAASVQQVFDDLPEAPKLSGNVKSEARSGAGFTGIRVVGPIHVKVQSGAPSHTINVSADDQLLPFVQTKVEGDELEVRLRCSNPQAANIQVSVDVPELTSAAVTGSGGAQVAGVLGAKFDAQVTGSGKLSVQGAAHEVSAKVTGSGKLDLAELVAKSVAAKVTGSGKLEANATDSLDAKVTGSGQVEYTGTAKVTEKVTGNGRVVKK